MSSDLYLIAHKVRNQTAFDIARHLCPNEKPCQPNCGGWDGEKCKFEGEWIIPTSGHRAYPYSFFKLDDLYVESLGPVLNMFEEMPRNWPDHYACNDRSAPASGSLSSILSKLGLSRKPSELINRRI